MPVKREKEVSRSLRGAHNACAPGKRSFRSLRRVHNACAPGKRSFPVVKKGS
ncbi:hypothetical protein ACIFOT_17900 [Neobacillus sp. NRS-1170]|uniref:hypothetical protein n=1 Tax=Neobacillus sp. NRS-1170 TaxID=3233898 RepID=UPI003D293953